MEVVGSAVGIASLGIQVCQNLLSYYNDWKDYKADIRSTYDAITDLSKTLGLLKTSIEDGGLDEERTKRVEICLASCEDALSILSKKRQKLQKYGQPDGLRQRAWAEVQKWGYPFEKKTLTKLREAVNEIQERLKLALQILHLDVSTNSQKSLDRVEKHVIEVLQQNQHHLAVPKLGHFQMITNWLAPPDPWTNHQSARRGCELQTGAWLLQSDEYHKWKDDVIHHIWISGKAGCGKTVLSSTVIEDIRAHCGGKKDVGVAFFYFSFSDNRKQAYKDLVLSLVAQLGWKEPGLSMLHQAYEKPNRSQPSEDELEKILLASLQSYGEVFLVLDALDESPDSDEVRQTMLEGIERLVQNAPNLKLFVISRELRDLRELMEMINAALLPIATSSVDADIQRYVKNCLSRDRRFSRLDARTKCLIDETISHKADGMFRWAFCQLQRLKSLKSTKPKYIKDILLTLPATLDETYERMLTDVDEMYRAEALTLLRWLAYAQSPPTLGQLVEAAIIDPLTEREKVDTDNRGDIEDTLNILGGLVTVVDPSNDDNPRESDERTSNQPNVSSNISGSETLDRRYRKVHLAHFSVKEYLESDRILACGAKDFFLNETEGHRFLTQSCLAYLVYYQDDINKSSTTDDFLTYPLLQYSALSWYYHSSLHKSGDFSHEVSFLSSESTRRSWLLVHQPDHTWIPPFGKLENIGSSLYYAAFMGLDRVVQMLLHAGANVNAQGGHYGNALQAASVADCGNVVQMLLDAGADVNAQGGLYSNALLAATRTEHPNIVQVLLNHGAELSVDPDNMTALHHTARLGNQKIAKIMLDAKIPVDLMVRRKIWSGTLRHGKQFWRSRADTQLPKPHDKRERGLTPLHYTTLTGSVAMSKFFLTEGANPNALSEYDETPLHLAIKRELRGPKWTIFNGDHWNDPELRIDYGKDLISLESDDLDDYAMAQAEVETARIKVLDTLLNCAITDLTVQDCCGMSPLHCIQYGSCSSVIILKKLLQMNIQVDQQDSKGRTALHLACSEHDIEAIDLLVSRGADVQKTDDLGLNSLHYAARSGDQAAMRLILQYASQTRLVNFAGRRDVHGQNALHFLLDRNGHVEIAAVRFLTANSIGVNDLTDEGDSPLAKYLVRFLDRSCHKAEIAGHLFDKGANPLFRTARDGLNLGHLAAHGDEIGIELLRTLLHYGVDLSAEDRHGRTILHHCGLKGSLEDADVLNFLCDDVGLPISSPDNFGTTPLKIAAKKANRAKPLQFRPNRWRHTKDVLQLKIDSSTITGRHNK